MIFYCSIHDRDFPASDGVCAMCRDSWDEIDEEDDDADTDDIDLGFDSSPTWDVPPQ